MKHYVFFLLLVSCLLSSCAGGTQTETSAQMDAAKAVLQAVASQVCPSPGDPDEHDLYTRHFNETDSAFMFACSPAMGHDTVATLSWFSNQDEAQEAFATQRETTAVTSFHGFPLALWEENHPSFPDGRKEYRIWLWQAQEWLIKVRAFDDTHFLIAPDPEIFSEFIFQVGIEQGLFADRNLNSWDLVIGLCTPDCKNDNLINLNIRFSREPS